MELEKYAVAGLHCVLVFSNMIWLAEDDSVTLARPLHPMLRSCCRFSGFTTTAYSLRVHRMPFESWRKACFAVQGTIKGMASLREPCYLMVPRRGLGHTSATPASAASDAFRILARSMLRCSGHKKRNGQLARAMLFNGAQKRTRSHKRDPGIRCIGCLSSPGAKHASLFRAQKKEWPACASHVI